MTGSRQEKLVHQVWGRRMGINICQVANRVANAGGKKEGMPSGEQKQKPVGGVGNSSNRIEAENTGMAGKANLT